MHDSQTLNFHIKVRLFTLKFTQLYYQDPLIDFINIWHDGMYRPKVFLSAIPRQGHGFEVKVTDLDISYKCQRFCLYYKDSD